MVKFVKTRNIILGTRNTFWQNEANQAGEEGPFRQNEANERENRGRQIRSAIQQP